MKNEKMIEKPIEKKQKEESFGDMDFLKTTIDSKILLFIIIGLIFLLLIMLPISIWKLDSKNKKNIDTLFTSTNKLNKEVSNLAKIMETKDVPTFSNEFKQIQGNLLETKEILNNNIKVLANEIASVNLKLIELQEKIVLSKDETLTKIESNLFLTTNEYQDKANNIKKEIKTLNEKIEKIGFDLNSKIENLNVKPKISELDEVKNETGLQFVLILQGVMQTSSGMVAYVSGEDKNNTKTVSVGSKINGWTVKEIKAKSIIIYKDGIDKEIFLDILN